MYVAESWFYHLSQIKDNILVRKIGSYPQKEEKMMKTLPNIHPGQILLEEFMIPFDLTQNHLAKEIGVSARRINEIVHGKRSITADTALRLAKYFETSPQFWMGLQDDYELEEAQFQLNFTIKPFQRSFSSIQLYV